MKAASFLFAACLAGPLVIAQAAVAQVCVTVDTTRDVFSETERATAVSQLSQALAERGQQIVATGCVATYTVWHLRAGPAITVQVTGPQGSRQATAPRPEDLPPLYDQIVRSLFYGQATSAVAPPPPAADAVWYLRLGPGLVGGPGRGVGPAFGFGHRYERHRLGVDLSFMNLTLPRDPDRGPFTASGSLIRLVVLRFRTPAATRTSYLGAGVSYGIGGLRDDAGTFSGSGLQAELTAGYEILRASRVRLFAQLDATLPLYMVQADAVPGSGARGSKYAPGLVFSLGLGWARGRSPVARTL